MSKVGKITIDDFEEKYRRLVEILGVDKTIELSREFGSTDFYIPSMKRLLKNHAFASIITDYSEGVSVRRLVRKYGYSQATIYSLVRGIKSKRKTEIMQGQTSLFD